MTDNSSETNRAQYILSEIEAYRAHLELEQTYPHWDRSQLYVFKLALKWLNQRFPTATRR